jgi:type I restriction enzyme S subunit
MSNKAKTTAMKPDGNPALTPRLRFPEFRNAGGWEAATLEEVAEFVSERIPVDDVELMNYISTENILPDYSGVTRASKLPSTGSVTRFRPNDTLVSNIRPYLKKGSSGMFWEYFIGRDKGLIPRSGRRYRF